MPSSLFDLSGRTALITGSSRGIGQPLGEAGARVILNSRKQADVDEAVAKLKSQGFDVRGAAIFLASAASNYVNGQIIYVDGGWLSVL